jgi:hypothetical protein
MPFSYTTELEIVGEGPTNQKLVLPLGAITIVYWRSATTLTYVGVRVPGGNVHGMTVTFQNISGGGIVNGDNVVQSFASESLLCLEEADRLRLARGSIDNGGAGIGAMTFRYHGVRRRWFHLGGTR